VTNATTTVVENCLRTDTAAFELLLLWTERFSYNNCAYAYNFNALVVT
jgi:hypothetical protein